MSKKTTISISKSLHEKIRLICLLKDMKEYQYIEQLVKKDMEANQDLILNRVKKLNDYSN